MIKRFKNQYLVLYLWTTEDLLRNAAKARIRRMVTAKAKRTDLAVPAWVREEWNKGTQEREVMASTLQQVNWDKDPWTVNS